MKKIALYFSMLAGIAFLGGCELNDYPQFDDSDAFVAFEKARTSVNEDAGTLDVSIRLTSIKKISSTVTFEIIDSTAKQGIDFNLVGGASVLTFDGSSSVQSIRLSILPHTGTFTGDRLFGIKITNPGSVDAGNLVTTWVTISDLDHPLAAILGNYTASGDDAWGGGVYSWNARFEKDASDVTKVWIRDVFAGYALPIEVYGIVNDDKTEISIPVHQKVGTKSDGTFGTISGYNAFFEGAVPSPFATLEEGEKLIFTINGNTITIKGNYQVGVVAVNPTTSIAAGWFERVGAMTFVKQ
jgi:hypothetical protein